jgi:hypothetical protein
MTPIRITFTVKGRVRHYNVYGGKRVAVICTRDGKEYETDLTADSDVRRAVLERAKQRSGQ